MKHFKLPYRCHILLIATILLSISAGLTSCHEQPEYTDDPYGNFDLLANTIRNRYCFLEEKNLNWDSLTQEYRKQITPKTKTLELFNICSDLLDNLKDGHVNLIAPFNVSYYRKWWSDYPQDFNIRTLQEYYLDFNYFQASGISYKMLNSEIGYMYYGSFSSTVGATNLDYILTLLSKSQGLIIDIRNNGGGALTNVNTLVGRFIDHEIIGGYIRHKLSPAPGDFSKPFALHYKPADKNRVSYLNRPIYILTNRSCFSAANNFVAVMKQLPNVKIVGAKTGGGGGLPFSYELPNGWAVRFSSCPINDANDQTTEYGIDPTPGYEMHSPAEELAQGRDAILDFAIRSISSEIANNQPPKTTLNKQKK